MSEQWYRWQGDILIMQLYLSLGDNVRGTLRPQRETS